jgi:hypothetical protein
MSENVSKPFRNFISKVVRYIDSLQTPLATSPSTPSVGLWLKLPGYDVMAISNIHSCRTDSKAPVEMSAPNCSSIDFNIEHGA